MATTFVNLTPHAIRVRVDDDTTVTELESDRVFPSQGTVRVSQNVVDAGRLDGIDLFTIEYGEVEGLPPPQNDTVYIVSGLVVAATDIQKAH